MFVFFCSVVEIMIWTPGVGTFPLTSYGMDLIHFLPQNPIQEPLIFCKFYPLCGIVDLMPYFLWIFQPLSHWGGTCLPHICSDLCNNKHLIKSHLILRFLFIVWGGLKTLGSAIVEKWTAFLDIKETIMSETTSHYSFYLISIPTWFKKELFDVCP